VEEPRGIAAMDMAPATFRVRARAALPVDAAIAVQQAGEQLAPDLDRGAEQERRDPHLLGTPAAAEMLADQPSEETGRHLDLDRLLALDAMERPAETEPVEDAGQVVDQHVLV